MIRTRTCAYQGVRIVSFSENFAHVLNRWLLSGKKLHALVIAVLMDVFQKTLNVKVGGYEAIVPDKNDYVSVVYDRRFYYGKVIEVDETHANITFLENKVDASNNPISCEPRRRSEVWIKYINTEPVVWKVFCKKMILEISQNS